MASTPLARCEIRKYTSEIGIADTCKKFHIPCRPNIARHLKNTYEEKEDTKGSPPVRLNRRK